MNRRDFVLTTAVIAASTAVAQPAVAYPQKPVKLIVGFPAGQATDLIARLFADNLGQRLGQPLIVENKPGQGGGLALGYLTQQPADGYAVSLANTGAVITNQFIQKSLSYSPDKLQPVSLLGDIPLILAANPRGKINTLKEFIEKAKANPGKLTYATPGNGTTSHLAMESLKQATGIDVLHIPYTGSSRSLTDLIAGNVDVSFDTMTTIQPFVDSGKLKALAIGTPQRVAALPSVPTLAEFGYRDIIGAVWIGVFVGTGTSAFVVQKLEAEFAAAVQDPTLKAKLTGAGLYVRYADAKGFTALLAADTQKIKKVVETSGIKVD